MSTLLDKSSRPFWVWIIVIVIVSIFVLGTITWLIHIWVRRRRDRFDVELISDEPAEKKLTLRRGRIVPATSYLSLTGSRFGVNSYTGEDDTQTPSVRSKSPFEWWTNLVGRSSRLSYVSHISSQIPSRSGSFYRQPEMSTSKLSLTSKDESTRATVMEVKVTKPQTTLPVPPFKRASRSFEPVNFSRSFTAQAQRSFATNHHHTLSRIEETTPRQSMFSTVSLKHRTASFSASERGQAIEYQQSKRASSASLLQIPPPLNHSRNASANSLRDTLPHQERDQPFAHHISDLPSSQYLPSIPTTPTFLAPVADPHQVSLPRQSLWGSSMKQFPCLEDHDNDAQPPASPRPTPTPDPSSPHALPRITTPEALDLSSSSDDHLASRPHRARSKKGNVLRKKSLERSHALSIHG